VNLKPANPLRSIVAPLLLGLVAAKGGPIVASTAEASATNSVEARRLAAGTQSVACSLRLSGVVLWVGPEADQFILQDASGGLLLETDLRNQPPLQIGQAVLVEGTAVAGGGRVREALVNNDGLHSATERAETIHLTAGRHPIRLDWFNGPTEFKLELDYDGPGLARQRIPDSALSDVTFRCYEGRWRRLPNFEQLTPLKTGAAANFDLAPRTRDDHVALQFSGFIQIPREGAYTFWLNSDDGSRLYIDGPSLRITPSGAVALPRPGQFKPGQDVAEDDDCRWVQAEGTLSSLHVNDDGGLEMELRSGTNRLELESLPGPAKLPERLSWIRATGVCHRTVLPGSRAATARLLIPGPKYIETVSPPAGDSRSRRITSIRQLRDLASGSGHTFCPVRLEGVVLAASPARGLLTLQLDSEAVLVEMDLKGQPLPAGARVALEGNGVLAGDRVALRPAPLIDNDGVHSALEKSASIVLSAGKHAIQLEWFNAEDPSELAVYYHGPELPRQRVPGSALFRVEKDSPEGTVRWLSGLDYRCYEGSWSDLPTFSRLAPSKEGTAANFDLAVASRSPHAGLDFRGFIEVPRDGVYTFSTVSDDGSLLFIDEQPTSLEVIGTNALPGPISISPGQILTQEQEDRWAQVKGQVTFASQETGSLNLELTSGTGRLRVEVADNTGCSPRLLRDSRIRATGICQATYTTDGQRVAGLLVAPGLNQIEILEVPPQREAGFAVSRIGDLLKTNLAEAADPLVRIRGKVRSVRAGQSLLVEDDTGRIVVETGQAPPPPQDSAVDVLGQWSRSGTNVILRCGFWRGAADKPAKGGPDLPLLATIEQVKGLSRQEAQRGYPVKIRGIITAPMQGGFFIQDTTWAIYVRLDAPVPQDFLRVGDYWEVQGVTFAEFAPNILARRAARLGSGILPEPFRPTWDQLINGSLDTRYVEVQGVVTAVARDSMALLTSAGKLIVELWESEAGALKPYENARIRVRGCVMPARDANNQVELGRIRLMNLSFNVDEQPGADPFAAPLKSVADLLFFDPRAGAIERVRIAGQLVHSRRGEYFLVEGTNGLRFIPGNPAGLRPGDLVEVVGFPDLTGPSPVLREAVARRTGQAPLPAPQPLSDSSLLTRSYDARLVTVKGHLASLTLNQSDQVLEMQTGTRGFVARLETRLGSLPAVAPGSWLELTGTYAGQGGDRASGRELDSFELLLNSPANIRVLESPPWWNLRHTVTVVGAMAVVILAAVIWITLLRRKVEERSRQLAAVMQRHAETERQRALEQERSRIARDLHDDLGATLTQIRFLSALESRDSQVPGRTRSRMSQVTEKARQMVASLDEIVWAVNPANDSLASLATYCCQFAEEFFRPTTIRCRLDVSDALPEAPLTSEVRHNLYLAVREALNNVLKHAQATEVWLRIQWQNEALRIALEDNGCGVNSSSAGVAGDGLANLRRRLEKIGGHFEFESQAGAGSTCRIWLPLAAGLGNPKSDEMRIPKSGTPSQKS
jgi:signal transduction histidine kinase